MLTTIAIALGIFIAGIIACAIGFEVLDYREGTSPFNK